MRVQVIVASRHGSTAEIGDAIAEVLEGRGHVVDRAAPGDVASLEGVDAVVLGSAIYMSQWLEPARHLVSRLGDELRRLPVWMFSSGPVGTELKQTQETARIHPLLEAVQPLDYRVFSGVVDRSVLSLRERSIVRMVGAGEGDYRDWDSVRSWATMIADTLAAV
jgi:menaquinone-dependent protoporphyrinogen oxidase